MKDFPLSIEELEKQIKYKFNNKEILKNSLTHSSYSNEQKAHKTPCESNERLEFLGDSVLSVIVSEYLYKKFSCKPEGELTKLRASVVCTRTLSKLASNIGLGNYLYLGKGEEETGRTNPKILENAFESLLAAIFLDSGNDIEIVSDFLLPLMIPEIEFASHDEIGQDYKTLLQQFIQASSTDRILYICVNETGPDHAKSFEVEARLNSNIIGKGIGKTKREAEQKAAKEALVLFDVK